MLTKNEYNKLNNFINTITLNNLNLKSIQSEFDSTLRDEDIENHTRLYNRLVSEIEEQIDCISDARINNFKNMLRGIQLTLVCLEY